MIQRERERDSFFLPQYCSISPVSELVTAWTSVPFKQDSSLSRVYTFRTVLLEFEPVQVTLSNIVLKI